MGVLTDLIIANESEAQAIAQSSVPSSKWRGIDAKGHSELTLGTLLCILRGDSHHEAALDEFPLLAQATEEGAWVFAVPNDLVFSLAQLDGSQIPRVVSEWLQTEAMQTANYEGAEHFVRELKSLAAEAVSQQRPMLMWMSL